MAKKTIVILVITAIASAALIYQLAFAKKQPTFNYEEAKRADVSQEVSVSGNVKRGDELGLNFKGSGQLKTLYVKVDDEVAAGQNLGALDSSQLAIQLQSASAQLKTAQINLDKLVVGADPEDIRLYQTALQNAQAAYQSSQQNQINAIALADTNLNNLYQGSLSTLSDADVKIYNAFTFLQTNIDVTYSSDLGDLRTQLKTLEQSFQEERNYLGQAKANNTPAKIDIAIQKVRSALELSSDVLTQVRESWQNRSSASAAQMSAIDTQRTYINTALSGIVGAQNGIALMRSSNQSAVSAASAAVISAQGQMNVAQGNLDKLLAAPSQNDLDLAKSQVDQSQSQVDLLNRQISETVLKAPQAGRIVQINKKEGEIVQSAGSQNFIVLIPKEPFQIDVNIPEVDIGQVSVGNPCRIDLDAFQEEQFSGQVVRIDPAETIIAGVVYYKTTVSLSGDDQRIKPGMTANVVIVTDSRQNVLTVPQRAILEKDGKKIVRLVEGGSYKEVEVKTGLKGVQGEIEISSGLKEGDKVVTFLKGQ